MQSYVSMESHNSSPWQPNEELLEMLTAMGISKIAAEHALYYTGNQSAEAAACYVFDNPDIDEIPPILQEHNILKKNSIEHITGGISSDEESESTYKMVFVVNSTLNMGVGKIATQVSHASLALYKILNIGTISHDTTLSESLIKWRTGGEKVIVLKGENENHLRTLEEACKNKKGLHAYCMMDGGYQVPSGPVTVLALFGEEYILNKVTGDLQLL